jgi:putative tryptophan/tyrosine transport system substrate-binding protein
VIDRRAFISSAVFSLIAAPLAADAQPAGKVRRLGYLAPGSSNPARSTMAARSIEAFRQGLRERGWVGRGVRRHRPAPI